MLSTAIIALREGLEASLIVGILVAYLVKTERRDLLRALWSGVFLAITASLAFGAFLSYTSAELTTKGEELFAGVTALTAVGLVTWMVFWMQRAARGLRDELQGKAETALLAGPIALAIASFAAVSREGLETSLFLYTNFKTVGPFGAPTIGLILGLAIAVLLGYGIYNRSVKINLGKFFTYSGVALIVVAAGVLAHGVLELQKFGFLPGAHAFAWDLSSTFSEDSLIASLISGTIGFGVSMTWLQLLIWALYLGVTIRGYLAAPKKAKTLLPA
jgi:high-affinity iron transporter